MTLGCKVNQYDSDAMRTLFLHRGYIRAEEDEEADVYVVNTCSVTGMGDKKSRQMIRRIRRAHPDAMIAATGCYAQLASRELEASGDVNVIVGTQDRLHIVDYVEQAAHESRPVNRVKDIMKVRHFENLSVDAEGEIKTRAFIKVQEGCNNFCTFCIIPYARGRLKSRREADAVTEIARLAKKGYREIVLTGIHLGNYGKDLRDGTSLSTLMEKLIAIPELMRIRLGSIESVELAPELIDLIRYEPKVCRHLHLPLQSGSESVLQGMHRHYHLWEYKKLIALLREELPGLALTTDLIVGFPGETEAHFEETLETLRELRFSAVHVFPYSPRAGTPAASYPNQVSGDDKKSRVHRVRAVEKELAERYRKSFLGKTVRVLAEEKRGSLYEGLSDEYVRVFMEEQGVRRGRMYFVDVDGLCEEGLTGHIVKEV